MKHKLVWLFVVLALFALALPLPALAQDGSDFAPLADDTPGFAVGRFDNAIRYELAQWFAVGGPTLFYGFDLELGEAHGAPVGTMTWALHRFGALTGRLGGEVAHGQFRPGDEAGVVTVDALPALLPEGEYALVWRATLDQRTGDYWTVLATPDCGRDWLPGVLLQRQSDPAGRWGTYDGQDVLATLVLVPAWEG